MRNIRSQKPGMSRKTGIVLSCLIFLSFFALLSPRSQGQTRTAQRIPRHDAAAVVKLVSVRVLDANGRPVTGLKKEDFVLYDNGEQKRITEFEIHSLTAPEQAVPAAALPSSQKPIPGTGRKFFILFDVQGSDINGIANAKAAAQHFVDTQLLPGDEVGVLYYAPMTGLNLVEYLTPDKEKIKKAIKRAKEAPPSPGFVAGAEVEKSQAEGEAERAAIVTAKTADLESAISKGQAAVADQTGGGAARSSGRPAVSLGRSSEGSKSGAMSTSMAIAVPGLGTMARRPGDYLANMAEVAKALQVIPGAKNIILFTARSMPQDIGRQFATTNTPVFTINTRNWIIKGGKVTTGVKEKFIYTDHPLKEFALASGGKYFADIEDLNTIAEEIQALSGNYYVLGYYIDEKWDGKYHKIKVKVSRPDCQVFAQEGFYNPRPYAQLPDIEKQLHLFDLAFADRPMLQDPMGISAEALVLLSGKGSNTLILSRLLVDEKIGVPPGKAELFTFIFDKDHLAVDTRRGEIDLSPYAQYVFYPYLAKALPPGEYEFRIVVRDMETGDAAVGRTSFRIPAQEPSRFKLSTPLLFVAGGEPHFIKVARSLKAEETVSLITLYPLFPKDHSPVITNLPSGTSKLLAVLPVHFEGEASEDVSLEVLWTALPSGEKTLVESKILSVKDIDVQNSVLAIEIRLPEGPPGDYDLEIVARDAAAQHIGRVKKTLTMK
jgi:VWFA-related protein